MKRLLLERHHDDGKQTEGLLHLPDAVLHTLERPWKNNAPRISCIPTGIYRCVPHGWEPGSKLRFKRCYRLLGTEPREAILFHPLNVVSETVGCIGVGRTIHNDALARSVEGMDMLRRLIGRTEWEVEIVSLIPESGEEHLRLREAV